LKPAGSRCRAGIARQRSVRDGVAAAVHLPVLRLSGKLCGLPGLF
jgi:hypothetical protein